MAARHLQLADAFEIVADAIPGRPALITDDIELTYAELDQRATRLANHLTSIGIAPGEHVGIHAGNCAEWVESFYACCKISAVPINVNFRYVEAELRYLYDNAECVAVIVGEEYTAALDDVRDVLPKVRETLVIGPQYEAALAASSPVRDGRERSPDDLYLLYTGGTTGMPKGVMWRHEDVLMAAINSGRGGRPIERPEQLGEEAAASPGQARLMALGPMMHGGAQWVMGNAFTMGGVFVLYTGSSFDPHRVWRLAERSKANSVSTIGDAMGRPLAAALADGTVTYDLSNLFTIGNGGAPLSAAVRNELKVVLPNVFVLDSYGASETGAAGSRADDGEGHSSPRFDVRDDTTVLTDEGVRCAPGEIGKLARRGHIPLGYFKDAEKTAQTFPVFAGERWVIPGDYARIEDDGSVTVLGRGSVSINSGGEKIYPEEVEAALKHHPAVYDAVVVGTPNERWGQQVTALIALRPGMHPSVSELVAHARTLVADFKSPKAIEFVPEVIRTPVGKADYRWAYDEAVRLLALGS